MNTNGSDFWKRKSRNLGSLVASRLAGRVSVRAVLVRGNLLSLLGAVVFMLLVTTDRLSVPWVV